MARRKRGIVQSGNTITFYGEDANALMAKLVASNCVSQKEAWALLKDKQPGEQYPDLLALALRKLNWKIPKRFQRRIDNEAKSNT